MTNRLQDHAKSVSDDLEEHLGHRMPWHLCVRLAVLLGNEDYVYLNSDFAIVDGYLQGPIVLFTPTRVIHATTGMLNTAGENVLIDVSTWPRGAMVDSPITTNEESNLNSNDTWDDVPS